MNALRYLILLTLFAALGILACSDSNDTSGVQPKLPPVASMEIDYNELPAQPKQKIQNSDSAITVAYLSAVAIGAVMEANLAIPKILLRAANNNSATNLGEGLWEWEYGASGPNGSFNVRLTGQVSDNATDQVEWNFYVSAENNQVSWDEILLFHGSSSLDGKEGRWNILNPESGEVVTSTNWSVNETETSLTLNIYDQENQDENYRVNYSFIDIVKTLSVENYDEDKSTVIQWDTQTKAGFIISTGFNNGNKSCWDSSFQDVSCTS